MITKGIQFGEIHSFYDLNLVLSSKSIPPASPKTNYVSLPGGDGSLDLTEAHGEIKYNDRDLSFAFTIHPDDKMSFEEKVSFVSNKLNGRYFERITNDKDPEYYFSGRVSVNEYLQDRSLGQIKISAKVKPYKMRHTETVVSVALTGAEKEITLRNERKPVVPVITCTNHDTTVSYDGKSWTLSAGTHELPSLYVTESGKVVRVSGTGTITFTYREGAL